MTGKECIDHLRIRVLQKREIPEDVAISLLIRVREEREITEGFYQKIEILQQTNKEEIVRQLREIQKELDAPRERQFAAILAELSRIASTGAASQRREKRWRMLAEELATNQEEILSHVRTDQVPKITKTLIWFGEAAQTVGLGIVANSITEVLSVCSLNSFLR